MANNNTDNDIILDIEVRYEDAIKGIVKYKKSIEDIRKSNADLKRQVKEGTIQEDDYHKAIAANAEITAQYNAKIRLLRKEIQNNIATEVQQEGSLKSLRAALSNATRQYDELGRSARNGLDGEKLLDDIKNIQEELTQAEQASGRFQRNVGNYQSINTELVQSLSRVDPIFGGIIQKLQSSPAFVNILGKSTQLLTQTLKLTTAAATGLQFALVGLVAAGIYIVVDAIKTWRQEQEKLNQMQSDFIKPMAEEMSNLKILFDRLQNAERGTKEYAKAKKDIQDKYGDYLKNQSKEIRNLEDQKEAYKLLTAEVLENARAKGLQESTAKATKKFAENWEKAIKQARVAFMDKFKGDKEAANTELEKFANKLFETNGEITKELEATYNSFIKKHTDKFTTYEINRLAGVVKLASNAFKELDESTQEANILYGKNKKQIQETTGAIGIQEQALRDLELEYGNLSNLNTEELKAYNKRRQAIDTEISRLKELGKVKVINPIESAQKERKAAMELAQFQLSTEIKTKKDIADNDKISYQERLNALNSYYNLQKAYIEKDRQFQVKQAGLTASQRALINAKAKKEQQDLDKELGDKALQIMQNQDTKQLNALNTDIQNKLATVKKGSEEELNLKIEQLELQRQAEVIAAEKTGADVAAINAKYLALEQQQRQKHIDDVNTQTQTEYQNRILQAQLNNQNTLQIQIAAKQAEIESLTQLDNESDADFLNRKLTLQKQQKQLEDDFTQYQIDSQEKYMNAISSIAGGFSELFSSLAEDSEAFASFAKAMALFQIGVDTAEALTAGIKQSQKAGPFPANLTAMATTITAILANIVKAKKYLTSAKQPKAPSFATGGLVTGAGSGTSDSIQANLSNGESVLTARATAMFSPILSAFNQIGGGVPIVAQDANQQIGEEMLTRAFAKAVSLLPNPIVGVREIANKTNQVKTFETDKSL